METLQGKSSRPLGFYVATVAVGATGAVAFAVSGFTWDGSSEVVNAVVALFAVGLAAELGSTKLHVGSATFSIAFIPFLAGVFLLGTLPGMLLGAAVIFAAEAVVRQKPWIKVVFNTSKEVLGLGLASSVYQALGAEPSVRAFTLNLPAVVGAGVTYTLSTAVAVVYAVSLAERVNFSRAFAQMCAGSIMYDVFATPIPALLAYLYVRFELAGVALLTVPLFIVRHIYVQNLRLEQSSRDLLDLMVKAIEARDPYTSGHSQRVMEYARTIAREAGLSSRQVDQIGTAALLHDVGKIYEEYAPLLRKEGKLSPDERKLLQSHPVRSAELVATISTLRGTIAEAVRHHHENYDGTGYPEGFAGEKIPIGARVIMIADTLDAMSTDRPYRRALPFEQILEEIRKYAGRQFDPRLAEIATRSPSIRRMVEGASAPVRVWQDEIPRPTIVAGSSRAVV
jgi:HD-GYP domain-containing protein (c-di-GMP phosphodiesterase class II)